MNKVNHPIRHQLQPTSSSCDYTGLSTLLSYYNIDKSQEELIKEVPQPKGEDGKPFRSVTAQLATWSYMKT